ncbi:primase [Pseudomonas phage Psp6]|nr:primase [Pseudomonas phage Psp6]
MAYNVQNPGVKVRWAPILKGVPGDGKSIMSSVLAAAMGERNVSSVGPAVVMNSGGFTDWAHGACVICMEELKMDGKNRYVIANAFKDNVTNSRVTINRKGKGLLPIINISNFVAFTNFVDAVPLEDTDRRWFVIFSPYAHIIDCAVANNVLTVKDLQAKFDQVFDLCQRHPGQVRKWLLEMAIPAWFDPNGHAPDTPEKHQMRSSGEDEAHALARQVIATGAYGVSDGVLSSACLTKAMKLVCMSEGVDMPKTSTLNKLLSDLGYTYHTLVKWRGTPHRVWVVGKIGNDEVRDRLEKTVTGNGLP